MASSSPSPEDRLVPVWLAIGTLFALFIGTCAGVLTRLSGKDAAAAVLTGGACFGSTLTLVVLIISLLRRSSIRLPDPDGAAARSLLRLTATWAHAL